MRCVILVFLCTLLCALQTPLHGAQGEKKKSKRFSLRIPNYGKAPSKKSQCSSTAEDPMTPREDEINAPTTTLTIADDPSRSRACSAPTLPSPSLAEPFQCSSSAEKLPTTPPPSSSSPEPLQKLPLQPRRPRSGSFILPRERSSSVSSSDGESSPGRSHLNEFSNYDIFSWKIFNADPVTEPWMPTVYELSQGLTLFFNLLLNSTPTAYLDRTTSWAAKDVIECFKHLTQEFWTSTPTNHVVVPSTLGAHSQEIIIAQEADILVALVAKIAFVYIKCKDFFYALRSSAYEACRLYMEATTEERKASKHSDWNNQHAFLQKKLRHHFTHFQDAQRLHEASLIYLLSKSIAAYSNIIGDPASPSLLDDTSRVENFLSLNLIQPDSLR